MADEVRLPHSDPERPLREVTAYLHGELPAEEKAAFEAHLPGCADCRESVRLGRLVFPKVDELLAEDRRPRKAMDALALFEEAQAKVEAEEGAEAAARRERPARWSWAPLFPWLAAAAGAAVAAAAALLIFLRPPPVPVPELTALVASGSSVESAPTLPGEQPPPRPAAVSVSLEEGQLVLRAPREKGDRYLALALRDARDRVWRVRRGEVPDPGCAKGCGPLDLRVDVAKLPAGRIHVLLAVSPRPIREDLFDSWVTRGAWQQPERTPEGAWTTLVARVR